MEFIKEKCHRQLNTRDVFAFLLEVKTTGSQNINRWE